MAVKVRTYGIRASRSKSAMVFFATSEAFSRSVCDHPRSARAARRPLNRSERKKVVGPFTDYVRLFMINFDLPRPESPRAGQKQALLGDAMSETKTSTEIERAIAAAVERAPGASPEAIAREIISELQRAGQFIVPRDLT
jgi:hypothetical protein